MSVEIKSVTTRKELKAFVQFYYDLYRNSPYAVPYLYSDELKTLTRDKNPAFAFCDTQYFMAYKDGRLCGRIAGIINRRANDHWQRKIVRFGWFDFTDDAEVADALLQAVADWGRRQGLTELVGPMGFDGAILANPAAWIMANLLLIPAYFHVIHTLERVPERALAKAA